MTINEFCKMAGLQTGHGSWASVVLEIEEMRRTPPPTVVSVNSSFQGNLIKAWSNGRIEWYDGKRKKWILHP